MMANQIWKAATIKMSPQPNGPPYTNDVMGSTQTFLDHNTKIEVQRAGREGLITGHKKDYVMCKATSIVNNQHCAIYGWFNLNGTPIQGLNPTSHNKTYVDYSQTPRLVLRDCQLNGNVMDLYSILTDPILSALISDEGHYDPTNIYKS
jgi:hypothetical protein